MPVIYFAYLSNKDIYCILKTCCTVHPPPQNAIYRIIVIFLVQVILIFFIKHVLKFKCPRPCLKVNGDSTQMALGFNLSFHIENLLTNS